MPETFLLVDGENIDATLGGSLLGRRPAPEERPRWDRVRDHAAAVWEQPVRGLFFLNGTGSIPAELAAAGLELYDLEDDVGAFTVVLPRIRAIPIERFDPWSLLG